jgi:hypothetical protein
MHQVLRGWLAELGQTAYAPGGAPVEEPGVGITPHG